MSSPVLRELFVVGDGGFAREVSLWALESGWDTVTTLGKGEEADFVKRYDGTDLWPAVLIGIGDSGVRRVIAERLARAIKTHRTKLIHPSARVGDPYAIGRGTIICPNVVVTTDVRIGGHVVLNLGVTVGHDARIDNFVSVMPQAAISGGVAVGEGAYLGTKCCVLEGITIGDGAKIGAGAVVTKDVPPGETWVGVPARPVRDSKLQSVASA